MPLAKVSFHPEAAEEVETARQWYAERSPPIAKAFLVELDLAVERVREALHSRHQVPLTGHYSGQP